MTNTPEGHQDITEVIDTTSNPRAQYLKNRIAFLTCEISSLNSRMHIKMYRAASEFAGTGCAAFVTYSTLQNEPEIKQIIIGISATVIGIATFLDGVYASSDAVTAHNQIRSNQFETANYRQVLTQAYLTNSI